MDVDPTGSPVEHIDRTTLAATSGRWWLAALAVLLIGSVWHLQRPPGEDPSAVRNARLGLGVKAPGSDPLILLGKLVLALGDTPQFSAALRGQIDAMSTAGKPESEPALALREAMLLIAAGEPDAPPAQAVGFMSPPVVTITGRLDSAAKACDPASELLPDIALARSVLGAAHSGADPVQRRQAAAAAVGSLSAEQVAGLKSRHGWFAEVLLSAGDPGSALVLTAKRQATRFMVLALVLGSVMVLAFLAGSVLLIVAAVMLAQGRLRARMVRPPPIESDRPRWAANVWLETVCVFAGGFLAVKLVLLALQANNAGGPTLTAVALGGNWALTTAIFWPVVRGLGWRDWRERIGWRTNRPGASGFAREVGCGLLGYLCALPVMVATVLAAFIIGILIKFLTGHEPISPRQVNKVEELLSGGPWITLVVVLLAVVWAPVVEESIFRGALYRHLRRGWSVLAAGLVTSLAFAAMHPYALLQMIVVGALGIVFALVREWRGSIIPCAVAHFVQNTVAVTMLSQLGPLMRG
ncbi:MAG: lysostaphin resistance A-like protein [Phycisphaerales bacterium]